tara:strand:- start:3785 stop:3889 length:105 start_codon:yes stop_codon:yes gene_type:complete
MEEENIGEPNQEESNKEPEEEFDDSDELGDDSGK